MSSILRRTFIILIAFAGLYSLYGIGHFKWIYHNISTPAVEFQAKGDPKADLVFVEFLNYACGFCKEMHPAIEEMLTIRKDVRYIARPVSFGEGITDTLPRIVFAAGLQDKFWEFHNAFLEYPEEEVPDDFIIETANLYGVDYERLIADSKGKEVEKLVKSSMDAMADAGLQFIPSFMIGDQYYEVGEEGVPDLKKLLSIVTEVDNAR